MLQLFQKEFLTTKQKILAEKVEGLGGDAALDNDEVMRELACAESGLANSGPESLSGGGRPLDFVELRQEIKANPQEAIEKNSEFFGRKLEIQRREIEEITRAFNRGGDRIISAIISGPHERIADPVWPGVLNIFVTHTSLLVFRISISSGKIW